MRGLKFFVESRFVFNPSCLSVWIGVDHAAVEIAPAYTLEI